MQNLIYLLIMALAGGAGWYGGSWRGRDAINALQQAKVVGQQAIVERDKLQAELQQTVTRLTSEFQQGQQARDAAHAQQASQLNAALASRDKKIVELGRSRDGKQADIVRIQAQINSSSTAPDERQRLQAEVNRLSQEVRDKETQIAGFECTKVAVPAELLLPLQRSGLGAGT